MTDCQEAITLLKEITQTYPYADDNYGRTICFYCNREIGYPHADTCVYARAKAFLGTASDDDVKDADLKING